MAFDSPHVSVKNALRNGLEPSKLPGRHNALPDDSESGADILTWIQHQPEESQPSTRTEQTFFMRMRGYKNEKIARMRKIEKFQIEIKDRVKNL
jgi:hypothetical protein